MRDPEHIWLIHDADADEPITWSDKPNPYAEYDEKPDRAVEYVRADLDRMTRSNAKDDAVEAVLKRGRKRANELPAEIAADENEKAGVCGDYGTETAEDYMDDSDVLLLHDLCDAIEAMRAAQPVEDEWIRYGVTEAGLAAWATSIRRGYTEGKTVNEIYAAMRAAHVPDQGSK